MITWIDPPDGDLDHIDVYRSLTADDADDFEKIGISPRFSQEYVDSNLYVLQTAWYKLKAVDVAKNESEFSAVISVTSEALPAQQIPEQSIQPSKLVPQLERLINEMRAAATAALTNSINEEENRTAAAVAIQELNTKVVDGLLAEAEARTLLAAQLNQSVATLQQLMQVVARAVTITQQAEEPENPQTGDIWEYETGAYRQWDGAAWQSITDEEMQATIEAVTATYSLLLDVNGNVAGIGVTNSNISGSEVAILADVFRIAAPNGDRTTVFQVDSEGNVQLVGDLIASGSLTGREFNVAAKLQLGAGGQLIMGDGSIFQMGSGAIIIDSETGVLQIRDPNNLTTGDYVRVDVGDISTYKYLNGAYREMKSLRKMHCGQNVPNNAIVTLPGYWPSQPNIIVSPCSLQSYSTARKDGNQTLNLSAADITWNATTGIASFRPVATLIIAAGNIALGASVANSIDTGSGGNITSAPISASVNMQSLSIEIGFYGSVCREARTNGVWSQYTYGAISYTLYINIGGTNYNVGSGSIDNGRSATFTASEPIALYKVHTNTIGTNIPANTEIKAYAVFTVSRLYEPDRDVDWEQPKNAPDYNKCWVKILSANGVTTQSQQLASGSLNYMAIAE